MPKPPASHPLRPVLTIRIYPELRALYARARVFQTLADMKRIMRAELWPISEDFGAMVGSLQRGKGARKYPHFADAFFHAGQLGSETIAHESFHILVAWAIRAGVDMGKTAVDGHLDERCAVALGRIVRQIVDALYRKKLIG